MAEDARISTMLPTHPKMVKLERRLGAEGAWSLIKLLLYAAGQRPTADLSGMSDEDIEIAAGWNREPGVFVKTLVEVRFLDGETNAYRIHDWEVHNRYAALRPTREAASRRANDARWEARRKGKPSDPPPASYDPESASDKSGVPTPPHLTAPTPHHTEPRSSDQHEPGLNPSEAARHVCLQLGISKLKTIAAVEGAIRACVLKDSRPVEAIAELMIQRGTAYQEAKKARRFEYTWGPESFFGDGHWADEASWPWKEQNGKASTYVPPPKSALPPRKVTQ